MVYKCKKCIDESWQCRSCWLCTRDSDGCTDSHRDPQGWQKHMRKCVSKMSKAMKPYMMKKEKRPTTITITSDDQAMIILGTGQVLQDLHWEWTTIRNNADAYSQLVPYLEIYRMMKAVRVTQEMWLDQNDLLHDVDTEFPRLVSVYQPVAGWTVEGENDIIQNPNHKYEVMKPEEVYSRTIAPYWGHLVAAAPTEHQRTTMYEYNGWIDVDSLDGTIGPVSQSANSVIMCVVGTPETVVRRRQIWTIKLKHRRNGSGS